MSIIFFSFLIVALLISLSLPVASSEDPSCTTSNEEGVCQDTTAPKCPSQTDLALEMARLSSPKALSKLKHILSAQPSFEVDLGGTQKVFDSVAQNVKTALEGFGLEPIDGNPPNNTASTILRLETFFSGNRKAKNIENNNNSNISVFFLQTEQICCSQYGQLGLPYLERCHLSPNCLIWEYSQTNWQFLNEKGLVDSVLLVPFLLQQRLDEFYPNNVPRLEQRPLDVVFFGVQTERRKQIQQQLYSVVEQHQLNWNIKLEEVENSGSHLQYMADHYVKSKICLILHGFGDKTPGEYHRLSELATSGCLPVVESFGDTVGIETYSTCGGVIFSDLAHIASVIHTVLETIARGESFRIYERLEWWRKRVQWDQLLKLIAGDGDEAT